MRLIILLSLTVIIVFSSTTQTVAQSVGDSFFGTESESLNESIAINDNANATAEIVLRPGYEPLEDSGETYQSSLLLDFPNARSAPTRFDSASLHLMDFGENIVADHQSFYSPDRLKFLAGMFLIGGAIANSPLDEAIRDGLRENLVYTPTDEYAEYFRAHSFLGDGFVLLPAYAAISITGKYLIDHPTAFVVGDWSERSMRSIFVGAPPLLITQLATGGSRPNEQNYRSDWRPFSDDNGVSGHAFMGAVPFLTAAKMSENRWWKGAFITASLIPGMSRITDDAHYPSQVFLGWTLAWAATSAVNDRQNTGRRFAFEPTIIDGSAGLGFSFRR